MPQNVGDVIGAESASGGESRFNKFIHFDNYSATQLLEIFRSMLSRSEFQLTEAAEARAQAVIEQLRQTAADHFGNGRVIRNLVEHIQQQQANRLAEFPDITREQLITIEESDVVEAARELLSAPNTLEAPQKAGKSLT